MASDRKNLLELVDAYAAAAEAWQKADKALSTAQAKERAARMALDEARQSVDTLIGSV